MCETPSLLHILQAGNQVSENYLAFHHLYKAENSGNCLHYYWSPTNIIEWEI